MSNIFLEKVAELNANPATPKRTSTESTFALSEGLGIGAGILGTAVGGRYLGKTRLVRQMAVSKPMKWFSKKFFGEGSRITGTHLGSEIGGHIIGGAGSYGAMKGVQVMDDHQHNKYLNKAASLFSEQH